MIKLGAAASTIKLSASELRTTKPTEKDLKKIKKNPIYIVLDNVMDTYNVGAIFRLADAVSAEKVMLCGQTETPPHTRIKKASINTTEWISWEYTKTAVQAIQNLRRQFSTSLEQYPSSEAKPSRPARQMLLHQASAGGEVQKLQVIAIEQDPKSVQYDKISYSFPIVLIVGHETEGVSKEALALADYIAEIPLFGVNKSLNVMVSLGIVLYEVVKNRLILPLAKT